MGLGRLLESCQVHDKVALEHSSKSTKYELEGSYDDLVLEHFSVLKTAKLLVRHYEKTNSYFLQNTKIIINGSPRGRFEHLGVETG